MECGLSTLRNDHALISFVALDYPPFFAYFEKFLSIPASMIDPAIVDLNNLNYNAWSVIVYQRATVILFELVLGAALLRSVTPSFMVPARGLIPIAKVCSWCR